jgi:hypothetical protein
VVILTNVVASQAVVCLPLLFAARHSTTLIGSLILQVFCEASPTFYASRLFRFEQPAQRPNLSIAVRLMLLCANTRLQPSLVFLRRLMPPADRQDNPVTVNRTVWPPYSRQSGVNRL